MYVAPCVCHPGDQAHEDDEDGGGDGERDQEAGPGGRQEPVLQPRPPRVSILVLAEVEGHLVTSSGVARPGEKFCLS